MNLFWQRIFGRMQSTAKVEAHYAALTAEYKRYVSVEQSKELAEYRELFHRVKSADFKEKKKTLMSRKYKDTKECHDTRKFNRLTNDKNIVLYYETLKSQTLKDYLAFKATPQYELLGKSSEVKKSPELKRLHDFEQSKEYKNYMRFHNSYIIKGFEELRQKVSTPEFKEANDFWADPKRWEKTPEFIEEKRYLELSENEDIQFFEKTDASKFTRMRQYTLAFSDAFDWNTLNASNWESGFNYVSDKLVGNHSFTNEKQANNDGNNVSVYAGELNIHTRKERKLALAWDKTRGFVNRQFEYTSDVLHGTNAICQQGGVFRAKIRFAGKDLTHAFWLTGTHQLPHVNVCVCDGKSIEVGTHWATKFEKKYTSTKVTGLNVGDYYIYSLEWTPKELIWYINNVEVFRTTDGIPAEPLFPMLNSFISSKQKGGEGTMQVDWVEVYRAQ